MNEGMGKRLLITPLTHSCMHVHTYVLTHVGGSEGSHCQKTQHTGSCPGEGKGSRPVARGGGNRGYRVQSFNHAMVLLQTAYKPSCSC